jgi:hypothetical protein
MFFDSLLYDSTSENTKSYNQIAVNIKSSHEVDITRQGVDQRFNTGARKYIEELISEQLSHGVSKSLEVGWFKEFNQVKVKDSTKFDLPKNLKKDLPGFGGSASEAGVSIQYEFDLKSGAVIDLSLNPAKKSDAKDAMQTINLVQPGDLTIRDLGYFSLDYFTKIDEIKAFFISRLHTKILVYEKGKDDKLHRLDFAKLYQDMESEKIQRLDKDVYIGEKEKFSVRLIIELMPEEEVAKRLHKVNKENKKKGSQTTEEYKYRARFNLFITNIKKDVLDTEAISKIYHVRWQIELIFKAWKSIFGMDNIRKMKYDRLMCLLNTRLLIILIHWETFTIEKTFQYKKTGKLLSIYKCLQTLKDNSDKLRSILTNGCKGLKKWFNWVKKILSSKHWLEKKKNKLGFEEIMLLKSFIIK